MAPRIAGKHRALGQVPRLAHPQRNQHTHPARKIPGGGGACAAKGTQAQSRSEQDPTRAPQGETVTTTHLYAALAAASHCAAGCSEKQAVWQSGKTKLYRYQPIARPAAAAPLLIVYALVNRPYMMDLQEDRSLIRGLLTEGLDVYLIDWGYPDGADRFTTLADYLDDHLAGCVEHILESQHLDALKIG